MFDGSSIAWKSSTVRHEIMRISNPDTLILLLRKNHVFIVMWSLSQENLWQRSKKHCNKSGRILKKTKIGTAFFGPEAEFFLFDDVKFSNAMNKAV